MEEIVCPTVIAKEFQNMPPLRSQIHTDVVAQIRVAEG
jgi:hypothetical protein